MSWARQMPLAAACCRRRSRVERWLVSRRASGRTPAMFNDPQAQLKSVEAGLINEFADRLPNDVIHAEFERAQREFHDARVKNFMAVLVHRRATDTLRSRVSATR